MKHTALALWPLVALRFIILTFSTFQASSADMRLRVPAQIASRVLPWGKAEQWGSLCASVFCELCTSTEARALSFSVLELREKRRKETKKKKEKAKRRKHREKIT